MGWLTGKPSKPREPVTCNQCNGDKKVPTLGMAPGGVWVQTGTKRCPGCAGRGIL